MCGYAKIDNVDPMISVRYATSPGAPASNTFEAGFWSLANRPPAASNVCPQPPDMATTSTVASTSQTSRTSFAMDSRAGARRPLRNVEMDTTASAASSGHSPLTPMTLKTASSASSWTAMYGNVATMPVTATTRPSGREPKRARMNSAEVTNPCACATDQNRVLTRNTSGVVSRAKVMA